MHNLARPLAFVLLAVIGIVSVWTPLAHAEIAARWFTLPNLFWFLPVPILVLVTLYGLIRAVARNAHYTPFLLTLVLIFLGYSGLGISLWPNIVPPSISIWDAASPPQSQGFLLVGTLFIIPFILGYTFWSYYVFRGKVTHEDGYH
jgi:cytochrome d ubiquinol oxidase subunit II